MAGRDDRQQVPVHDYLCHEVLYDRLPAGRRARLHRKLGARLVEGFGPRSQEVAAEIAAHFVRGGDADRAVRFLTLAADTAGDRRAYREAIGHLRTGVGRGRASPTIDGGTTSSSI